MHISVTHPIDRALRRMGQILFKPFDVGKWFTLGFCVFLAYLGEGGGANIQLPGGGPGGPPGPGGGPTSAPIPWLQANLNWLLPLVLVGLIVIVGLTAVLIWLRSRGKFMFLDGIVRNRGAVVKPWKEFRELGNSLFGFTFLLNAIGFGAMLLIAALAAAIAWPDILAGRFDDRAIAGVVIGGILALASGLTWIVVGLLLESFVVPAMYHRNERVMDAWRTVRQEILAGHGGTIVLFYLMKIVLGIAIAIITFLATCLTCCLAALPYLGSVLLLPIYVFSRCYTLHFIQQFGPQWAIFQYDRGMRFCARCGYDLTGNVTGVCSECGMPIPPPMAEPPEASS